MATLTGKTIANTYKDLLQVSNNNDGLTETVQTISDGSGTNSALQLSNAAVNINGTFQLNGESLTVNASAINNMADIGSATGIIVVNSGSVYGRTLTAGAPVSITNANGTAGNPTITLASIANVSGSYGPFTNFGVNDYGQIVSATAVSTSVSVPTIRATELIAQTLTLSSDASVVGNLNVDGAFTVDGIVSAASDVAVSGSLYVTSNVSVTGNLKSDFLYAVSASVDDMRIGTLSFTDVSVSAFTASNLTVEAATSLDGTLDVGDNATFDSDVTFTGASYNAVWDKSDNALEFADNAKAKFGNSGDLEIYAASGASYVKDVGSGSFNIMGTNLFLLDADGEYKLGAVKGGAVTLYHDNSAARLATSSTGVSVTGDVVATDDLYLDSDAAVIHFGDDGDVTLTHVADTGLLLNSTMALQFNDASQYINAPSATVLDINATDEVEVNATLMDVNANLDVSGTYTGGGLMTTGGNIVIPDGGNIGSASDTDAIAISSGGVVTFSQTPVFSSDLTLGDDLYLDSDGAVIHFGDDGDVTLTHVADTGLLLNSTRQLQFGDSGTYIHQSADGVLDLVSDTEIEINATTIDINGAVDVSGAYTGGGLMTTGGNIVIPDGGNIGSASDTNAIAIASDGLVTLTQDLSFSSHTTTDGHIQLYNGSTSSGYAIGVEGSTLYFRSPTFYRWYINTFADGGTSDFMQLSGSALTVGVNLGIGTTSPASLLDINGTDGIPFTLRGTSSSASLGMGLTSTSVVIQAQTTASESTSMVFKTAPSSGTETEAMRITGDGNVGIGTTSPGAELEIAGDYNPLIVNSTTGTTAKIILENNGTVVGYLGAASGYPLIISRASDAANQFQFKDLNGYSKLNFAASTTAGGGAGGAYLQAYGSNAASPPQIAGIDLSMTDGTDGSESGIIAFHTTNSGTSAERMRLTSAGELVIGASAATSSALLTISGAGSTTGSIDPTLAVVSTGTGGSDDAIIMARIGGTTANSYIMFGDSGDANAGEIKYAHTGDTMRFSTAAAERMRIGSDGMLMLGGSTSSYDTTPPVNGLSLYYESDTGTATIGTYSSGGTTQLVFSTNTGGGANAEAMRITGDGNVGIGTSSPGAELEVAGDYTPLIVNSTNGSNYKIKMENNGSGHGYLGGASTAPIMLFDGSAVELLRLNTDGVMKFSKSEAWEANGTNTVTISNVAPSGVGTATISKWLKVIDNGGTEYFIPAWT